MSTVRLTAVSLAVAEFSLHVTCGRGSVLLWCASGSADALKGEENVKLNQLVYENVHTIIILPRKHIFKVRHAPFPLPPSLRSRAP